MVSIPAPSFTRPGPRLGALLVGFALAAAACSGGSEAGASDDVATLETDTNLSDAADAATLSDESTADVEPDEAALAFSQCMRDEGIDFPDLAIDADGNLSLRDAFQGFDRNDEDFAAARQTCIPLLGETAFGNRREALESPEIQDALLEFTDCVRDAGYDVGDLTLGGRGQGGQGDGDGDGDGTRNADAADGDADGDADAAEEGEGQGRRQGGFGNRNARYATNLGLDYEDPDVMATIDGCAPVIDEAFASAGIGQQGGAATSTTTEG